jgi:O-methyltransferase
MEIIYEKFKDYTMVPKETYINNLLLVEKFKGIEGCVVECGVWKGGMIAGIGQVLGNKKEYHLFDSFEGLPQALPIDGKAAIEYQQNKSSPEYHNNCKTSAEFAMRAMDMARLGTHYQIHKGWFRDTLIYFDKPISVLRLDGDWHESTWDCLHYLFYKVIDGGLIIIDDYYAWEGCTKAIHEWLVFAGRKETIMQFNNSVCYIVKEKRGLI